MSINFNPNNIIFYPTAVQSQMINSIDQELKMAITGNHCERIKELLNSNLDSTVSSKLILDSLCSLEEEQLSQAEVILDSNSFYDIPISDLKKIFFHLIEKKKFKILNLLINNYKSLDIQEEIFEEFGKAITNKNNDLIKIILNCNIIKEFPEERLNNYFQRAEKTKDLSIIEDLIKTKKISSLPDALFPLFIRAESEFHVKIAILIINSTKSSDLPDYIIELAFDHAVNKGTILVEHILNSRRARHLSLEILSKNSCKNKLTKRHYIKRLHDDLHKNSSEFNSIVSLKNAISQKDYLLILTLLNCKKCNNPQQLPIDQLATIFSFPDRSYLPEILNALLKYNRVCEINNSYFKYIINIIFDNNLDLMNQFMIVDPDRTQKYASEFFEQALQDRHETRIKNFLSLYPDTQINLIPSFISAMQENNLSLIEIFLSFNKIEKNDLIPFVYSAIVNEQIDFLHKIVLYNKSIYEEITLILETHFPNLSFKVSILDYLIKNDLPTLTKTVLPLEIFSRDTFPISEIINHAIQNNNPDILEKLVRNFSPLKEEELFNIIDYSIKNNHHQLLEITLQKISDHSLKRLIDLLLSQNVVVIERLISVAPERIHKFASLSFKEALDNRSENTIKNFLSLYPNIEINLVPSLLSAVREKNLSLVKMFLSSNRIKTDDLLRFAHDAISNREVDFLHQLVLHNKSIYEEITLILQTHFPNSPFKVNILDYLIKNDLPALTKTVLPLEIFSRDTFPISEISNHAIQNNNPDILEKLVRNFSPLKEEELFNIIDYSIKNNDLQLLQTILDSVSISNKNSSFILNSLVNENKSEWLKIVLATIKFSEENLLSSIDLALERNYTKSIAAIAFSNQISRENLMPLLENAVKKKQRQVISAICCSKNLLITDLQPIFEDSIKNCKLSLIEALASCKQFSKDYLVKKIELSIQNKNTAVLKALISSEYLSQFDIDSFLVSIPANREMADVFLTLLTYDKFDDRFLHDLLNRTIFINLLDEDSPLISETSYLNDASYYLDCALRTKNKEIVGLILKKTNKFSKNYIQYLTEHVISKGLQTHLETLLSSYDYTKEELEKLKNKSPENLKWIFNRKLGSILGYVD